MALLCSCFFGCGKNQAAKCVEGQSSACACPGGASGAQTCAASGAFGPCSCSAADPSTATAGKCSLTALGCTKFPTNGQTGWGLHKLVFDARNAKRFEEAICLADHSRNSADKVLAGASNYEASYAWEGLGCRAEAVSAIEESLRVRPSDKNGWRETCARCDDLKANCNACETTSPERIACPSTKTLLAQVGPAMLARAPKDMKWSNPSVTLCIPIGLPQPGWYVVARVAQDAPDRDMEFHLAVDAKAFKVIATSEADQRSIREACDLKLRNVQDQPGAPSSLTLDEDCVDKMERESKYKITATIAPPRITLTGREIITP